ATSNLAGSTIGTQNITHGTGCSVSNYGVWYTFVGNDQLTTISTTATGGWDHEMNIVSGNCGSFTTITCEDGAGSNGTETYTFSSVVGTTYYVYVSYYASGGTTTGTFTIDRVCIPAPSNNPCTSAITLACATTNLPGTTIGATSEAPGTGCTVSNYGVWYAFVGDGGATTISCTATSGWDHEMNISSGSCGALSNLSCEDGTGTNGTESYTFTTVNGTVYYVYIAHYIGSSTITGDFTITRTCVAPPCSVVAGSASASPSPICPAPGNTTLTLTGEDPAATIQWQVSTNGGATWSNIAGATTDPWVQSVSVNSMFQALVTNGCTNTSLSASVSAGCNILHPSGSGVTQSSSIICGNSYNYYDNGGSGSNYSNNQNALLTLCPTTAGQSVTITVNTFNVLNNDDYLYIFDGDDGTANIIGIYTGTALTAGTVITASSDNSSGCLSFRLLSDGFSTQLGWDFTVTCTATPAAPYATPGIEDCNGASVICSDAALTGGTGGYGSWQELPAVWNSCINPDEHQSNWYIFSSSTNGTIAFQIVPSSPTDYDWAVWGPYTGGAECPAFTNDTPIRCSSTSLSGTGGVGSTGLAAPATDIIEQNGEYGGGANENGQLMPLAVLAGEIYVMMIDNWDNNSQPFQLDWTLTNGATLDCTPPLPVSLTTFVAQCEGSTTRLEWSTASETNNNYFIIEKSDENFNFIEIGKVFGSGTSSSANTYTFIDDAINNETTYYRLLQVDFDGSVTYHHIIASNCQNYEFEVVNSNLTLDQLDLLISSGANENLTIRLYNMIGDLISQQTEEINAGNNSISLKNFNINSGIYLISIQGEYHTYATKLFAN
ncbi:MAG: T9SS type A sorting domain-containing protein, partial [Flavobacteriales bacterium]|nr:T9SS type A sorting domain-containing protein [Flavobacteriales bacterium]